MRSHLSHSLIKIPLSHEQVLLFSKGSRAELAWLSQSASQMWDGIQFFFYVSSTWQSGGKNSRPPIRTNQLLELQLGNFISGPKQEISIFHKKPAKKIKRQSGIWLAAIRAITMAMQSTSLIGLHSKHAGRQVEQMSLEAARFPVLQSSELSDLRRLSPA